MKLNNNQINLIILVIGRLISDLGTWIFRFALSLYILDVTGSAAKFSLLFGLSILPGVIVPFIGGGLIDRFNRKKLIIVCELASGIIVFALSLSFIEGEANILLFSLYALLINIFQALVKTTILAFIPNVVDENYIVTANSYMQGIMGIVNMLGPIFGALVYAKYGLITVFYIDGISFIIAGVFTFSLVIKHTNIAVTKENFCKSLKSSITYIRTFPGIQTGVIVLFLVNLILIPIIFIGTTYVTYELFKMTKQESGTIQSFFFIGILVGAVIITVYKLGELLSSKFFSIIKLLAIALSIMLIIPFINPTSTLLIKTTMFGSMFFLGLFMIAMQIPLFSSLQIKIPDKKRGSVIGILSSSTEAAAPLGIWMYGLLFGYVKWYYLILFAVISIFLIGIVSQQNKDLKDFVTIKR